MTDSLKYRGLEPFGELTGQAQLLKIARDDTIAYERISANEIIGRSDPVSPFITLVGSALDLDYKRKPTGVIEEMYVELPFGPVVDILYIFDFSTSDSPGNFLAQDFFSAAEAGSGPLVPANHRVWWDLVSADGLDVTGTSHADVIQCGFGSLSVKARGGNDTCLYYGGQCDADGGEGRDLFDCSGSADRVVLRADLGIGRDGRGAELGLSSFERFKLTSLDDGFVGRKTAESVTSGKGDDDLNGGGGNDTLNGQSGNDSILGGTGNDRIVGGAGADVASGGSGKDTVGGGQGADTLSGNKGDDILNGGAGADLADGGLGDDILFGGKGSDTLTGGSGNDTLSGGPGRDTFKFNLNFGTNVITDFNKRQDTPLFAVPLDPDLTTVTRADGDTLLEISGPDGGSVLFQGTILLDWFFFHDGSVFG